MTTRCDHSIDVQMIKSRDIDAVITLTSIVCHTSWDAAKATQKKTIDVMENVWVALIVISNITPTDQKSCEIHRHIGQPSGVILKRCQQNGVFLSFKFVAFYGCPPHSPLPQ